MKMAKMHEAIRRIARERFGSLLHGNSDRDKSSGQLSRNQTDPPTTETQEVHDPEPQDAEIVREIPSERLPKEEQNGSPAPPPPVVIEAQQFPVIKRGTETLPVVFGHEFTEEKAEAESEKSDQGKRKSGTVWGEHLIEAAKRATGSIEAALRRERDELRRRLVAEQLATAE